MEFISSEYNYTDKFEDRFIVLNGITGNILTLPMDKYGLLFDLLSRRNAFSFNGRKNDTVLDALIEDGFIVDSVSNEVEKIRNASAQKKGINGTLSIVHVLTYRCNMRCLYCYQNHNGYVRGGHEFPGDSDEHLFVFLKAKAKGYGRISLRLYGGEPLLEYGRIIRLLHRVHEFCNGSGLAFVGDMVTNGYLLSAQRAKELTSLGINRYEISLDGTQPFHDRRRPLASGDSSFKTVMGNIDFLVSEGNAVVLRANIDGTNTPNIFELIEIVKKRKLRVTFKFSPVEGRKEYLLERGLQPLSINEFSRIWWDLARHAIGNGFKVIDSCPQSLYQKCPALNKDFFIIDGYAVQKCFQEIGNSKGAVYTISAKGIKRGKFGFAWEQWSLFEERQCIECRYLPICLGGCPYYRIAGLLRHTSGNLYKRIESCTKWRYIPDKIISSLLQKEKTDKEIK